MKKNFLLTSPTHKPDRHLERIKHEINKYIARERRKDLPEGILNWEFNCKCGPDATTAVFVHVSVLGKHIDEVFHTGAASVYIEIVAKIGQRKTKD